MSSPDFELRIQQRLECCDHHAIFSRGCCYHFALKLNEIYGYAIAYLESKEGGLMHCWVRKDDGMAIDINGILSERNLVALLDSDPMPINEIDRNTLLTHLQKRAIPEELNEKIFALADRIIRAHERFYSAKTKSNTAQNIFGNQKHGA